MIQTPLFKGARPISDPAYKVLAVIQLTGGGNFDDQTLLLVTQAHAQPEAARRASAALLAKAQILRTHTIASPAHSRPPFDGERNLVRSHKKSSLTALLRYSGHLLHD